MDVRITENLRGPSAAKGKSSQIRSALRRQRDHDRGNRSRHVRAFSGLRISANGFADDDELVNREGIVFRILPTASLIFAWLCANGALWDAAQVFAWGKMFAGYAETMPVASALRETFDPAKPCDLCVGVATAKQAAQTQVPADNEGGHAKFVLALHLVESPAFAAAPAGWDALESSGGPVRIDPVPIRPPRI